ncbi:ABC transporter substrate-binding protein [Peribacillus sp. SCS-26]|uniref:ABC transporter substrate-binding protein n=1 Tax=Paraperibacillus marinus TaxID=3115295 RepID=UPI003906AF5E
MIKHFGIYMVLLLLLTSCSQAAEHAAKKKDGSDGLQKVSIMLDWYPNAVHSFLYVAEEKGYFEEEGIKADIQFPANPTDPLNLAAAGKVTLGLYYQPDVIMARANGNVPVKSVAAIVQSPLNHVVFLQDSKIKTPKDLEGKEVGYPGITLNEALLKTMVEHDGGDFGRVGMIDVGFDLGTSIAANKTDAVIGAFINHEVPVLKHKGISTRNFNPTDYGVPAYNELVIVTSDQTWDRHRDTIRAFWRAAEKGFEYVKEHPDEALDILVNHQDKANFPLNREVERESLDILLPKMETSDRSFGSQDAASWTEVMDWMRNSDLMKTAPKVDEMMVDMVSE